MKLVVFSEMKPFGKCVKEYVQYTGNNRCNNLILAIFVTHSLLSDH